MTGRTGRTGAWNTPWVELPPKPPPVDEPYDYWADEPPDGYSERCMYWVHAIRQLGWRPNRRISGEGYDTSAHWYGVYLWEYLHVIFPILTELQAPALAAAAIKQQQERAQLDQHRARRAPGDPIPVEFIPSMDHAARDTGQAPQLVLSVLPEGIVAMVPRLTLDNGYPTAFNTLKIAHDAYGQYWIDTTGTAHKLGPTP